MLIIVGILTFKRVINFILILVEHEKKMIHTIMFLLFGQIGLGK